MAASPELQRLLWFMVASGCDAIEIARVAEKPWCYPEEYALVVMADRGGLVDGDLT